MADKNLDGNGLSEVWVRAAQLVKKYTGAVDSTKGDLQTQVNEKLSGTDDTKDNTVTFTSADESNPTEWKDVNVLSSNEKHSLILDKISNMFSNIRYLYKNVGGIKGLSSSSAVTTEGQYALDAREKNASVEGTLANQISNLNSNFDTKADKDQISNPNLLDNAWFNVNSRGQSEYTKYNSYAVDRWQQRASSSNLQPKLTILDDGGINLSAVGSVNYFNQNIKLLDTSYMYTASVLLKDGTLYTYSSNNSAANDAKNFTGLQICFRRYENKSALQINVFDGFDFDILAVKLEKGLVSTILMDTPPNPEEERIRCMLSTADATDTYANKGVLTEDLWNSTKTYSVGEYCIYNGSMWKCLVENSGVTPVEGDTWTATSISAELASIISKIDALSA